MWCNTRGGGGGGGVGARGEAEGGKEEVGEEGAEEGERGLFFEHTKVDKLQRFCQHYHIFRISKLLTSY
jgi:hypothetical protein